MYSPRFLPLISLSFLIALSCHAPRKVTGADYRLMDTITVSARNNPNEIYRAASTRIWEILHTDVTLRFDLEQRTANGNAILTIQPKTIAADTLVLDAKGMLIKSVSVIDGSISRPLTYKYENDQLAIPVKGLSWGNITYPSAQKIEIAYVAQPYGSKTGGSVVITEDRGLYFINTDHSIPGKPVQIWTQGETESNSHWLPTIDKPNQRTTLDIALIVPDSMQTLSNGRMLTSKTVGNGLRRDSWQMDKPIQVYAIMFAIGHFAIAKDHWTGLDGQDHEVSYYTEPAYGPYLRDMFKYTPEMIGFFSKVTGVSYPWNKYNQVVVRDYVSGAMENTTASLFGEFMNQNFRQLADATSEDVVSHELFHQWFGDYVTAESWSNLTVNESFATYGEQLWRRYKYGTASSDELAYDDLQRYLSSAQRNDPALVRYYYRDKEDMFDRVSYQKGASILRYINTIAGDTLFNRAMKSYLQKNALQSAEVVQWRLALEEATGQDWTQFFSQWYYRGGHPVVRVQYNYDDSAKLLKVTVQQKASPDSNFKYTLPMKAMVITGQNSQMVDWMIKERTQTYTYPYSAGVKPVIIPDAMHVMPGVIMENKTPEQWLVQLDQSDNYISKRLAIDGAMSAQSNATVQTILDHALSDKIASIRAYGLQQLPRISRKETRDALVPKVKYLLQTDGNNKVRAAALTALGSWKEKDAFPLMMNAISDSSYLVSGSALDAIMKIDKDTAYQIAQRIIDTDPKGYLMYVTWTAIVDKGAPADIVRFEKKAPLVYGSTKTAFAGNMQKYALAVKDNAIYERTLKMLLSMAQSENIRGYRLAIGSALFELRDTYKKQADRKGEDGERAKTRLAMTQKYIGQLVESEKDPANIKQYKELGE